MNSTLITSISDNGNWVVPTSIAAVAGALVLVHKASKKPRLDNSIPGPKGLPIVGNVFQFDMKTAMPAWEEWCWQYGTLYKINLFGQEILFVSDMNIIQQVLRDRPNGFKRNGAFEPTFKSLRCHGMFSEEGDEWRHSRHWITPTMSLRKTIDMRNVVISHAKGLRANLEVFSQKQEATVKRWFENGLGVHYNPNESLRIADEFDKAAINTIVDATFAWGNNMDTTKIKSSMLSIFEAIERRIFGLVPLYKWFPSAEDKKADQAVDELYKLIDDLVAKYLDSNRDPNARTSTLLESVLFDPTSDQDDMATMSSKKASKLTPEQIRQNLILVIIAGYETTATTFTALTYRLSIHPDVQRRVHEEIDTLLGDIDTSKASDEEIAALLHDPFNQLPYTNAVIKETLRLNGPAPALHLQPLQDDCMIENHHVPKEALVFCMTRVAALRSHPSADPFKFDPELWLTAPEEDRRRMNRNALAFGDGPRLCPGRHFAQLEILMFMVLGLSKYWVEPMPRPPSAVPVQEIQRFTSCLTNVHVRLIPRK